MPVPQPVAPPTSRGDVVRIPAAIAPRHKVLCGCLKPARLAYGQVMPRGELGHVIEPHRGTTVKAAAVLLGESGTTQTNHDGMTHGRYSARKKGGSPFADAAIPGYPPAKAVWANHRRRLAADSLEIAHVAVRCKGVAPPWLIRETTDYATSTLWRLWRRRVT